MMNPFSWLQMTNMISYQGLVRTFPRGRIRENSSSKLGPKYIGRYYVASELRVGCCPLLFAEVKAQGQERRHGRRRRRRRYRDVPSASFRQTFCLNRGNPTQEGEQVGVAFLLVTFLWPRKEKSLAKPRSGGETPSRTESSCPARRSRAIEAWDDIAPGNDVTDPSP